MKKTILKKYANLLIRKGLNVQPGQEVEIIASLDQPEFVKMCVEEAYKAKAKSVKVRWNYQPLEKLHINNQKLKDLSTLSNETKAMWEHREEALPCMLYLVSDDPDGMNGTNFAKYAKARKEQMKWIKPLRKRMENKYQWCIAGVPGEAWAKKIYPNLSKHQAVEALWQTILDVSRVNDDPLKAWDEHNADLEKRCAYLNSLEIDFLEYHSESSGTNFKVWPNPNAIWEGGNEKALGSNIVFNPNIPSEEVFTSPTKGKAEGIVYASKPLSYNGKLIENFWIKFENGKAVDFDAEEGKDLLKEIIETDENSCYLGECALVPYHSPIQDSGVLFYETLYDENAACHLALGMGFTNLIKNYENYSQEELYAMGINDSSTHVDFMIGTKDLNIVAHTKDGKTIQIFKDGNWAF